MVGKTIKNVTYYTSKGIFTLPVDYKVLEHVKDSKANVENASVTAYSALKSSGSATPKLVFPADTAAFSTFTCRL